MKVSSYPTKLLMASSIFLTGCVSCFQRIDGEEMTPYKATSEVWNEAVCVWWHPSTSIHNGIAQFYIKMSYPFWVVDYPCEAVVDTICLPFDIWNVIP